jgi:hypothetical protein
MLLGRISWPQLCHQEELDCKPDKGDEERALREDKGGIRQTSFHWCRVPQRWRTLWIFKFWEMHVENGYGEIELWRVDQ